MRTVLAWVLLTCSAIAAELSLVPPSGPIEPREYAQIVVYGIADQALAGARVDWSPRDGTTVVPARLWGGQPFLLFSARTAGSYTLTITVNGWRQTLDQAVAETTAAAAEDSAVGRLRELAQDLAARFPTAKASCVVEVAGAPPRPTPTPDPPAPVSASRYLVILRESETVTPAQAALYLKLRTDKNWLQKLTAESHQLEILDPQTKDRSGNAPEIVARCLAHPKRPELPAVFVCELRDGKPGQVLSAAPLPDGIDDLAKLLASADANRRRK